MLISGQINKLGLRFNPIDSALLVHLSQHRAAVGGKHTAKGTCWISATGAVNDVQNGIGQCAPFRKTNLIVLPKTMNIENRYVLQRVPSAVMGVTAVIAYLQQESPDGDNGLLQFAGQFIDLPALFVKEQLA